MVHTLLEVHWSLVPRTPALLIFTRKTRELIGIVPATKSKVRIHFFHAEAVVLGLGRHLSIGGIFNQGPLQAVIAQGDVGMRPDGFGRLDRRNHHRFRNVKSFNQHMLAGLQAGGMMNKEFSQTFVSWVHDGPFYAVGSGGSSSPKMARSI